MARYTSTDLLRHLANLGIPSTATLLVHSSVRSVGHVDGRAEGILDALLRHMDRGLLVLPTLSWNSVNARQPRFSVLHTPSCAGALTERFRLRPDVVRSWHPTHSVTAFGADAESFTAGHERFDTPCARASPWGRLVDREALALFIGCGLAFNTLLHGVEEWSDIPGRLSIEHEPLEVETPDGHIIPVPSRRHIGHISDNYDKLEALFVDRGIVTVGVLGDARCHLARVRPMANLVTRLLTAEPDLFSHRRPPAAPLRA